MTDDHLASTSRYISIILILKMFFNRRKRCTVTTLYVPTYTLGVVGTGNTNKSRSIFRYKTRIYHEDSIAYTVLITTKKISFLGDKRGETHKKNETSKSTLYKLVLVRNINNEAFTAWSTLYCTVYSSAVTPLLHNKTWLFIG